MSELIGGSGYDDVQNTAPTSPSVGDTWLDTSNDPPTGKVYADLGGGGQWTTDLLDAPISSVGGVDWASKTIGIVESKTQVRPRYYKKTISVSGSGYVLDFKATGQQDVVVEFKIDNNDIIKTDASTGTNGYFTSGTEAVANSHIKSAISTSGPMRFESSAEIVLNNSDLSNSRYSGGMIVYALD